MTFARKSGAARREEMIKVAAAMILKKGLKATTTRDITTKMGVGRGLLNHYFSWEELRALAFSSIAENDIEHTFLTSPRTNPEKTLKRYTREAFSKHAEPYWRLWMEAIEEAVDDERLAQIIHSHAAQTRENLQALLTLGVETGKWQCKNPKATTWRIVALQDGLLGFLLLDTPGLTRRQAARLFEDGVKLELE
ncbi:MAG: TetR/AcrR family transcriptional regulator [Granulosicoccus sp.]